VRQLPDDDLEARPRALLDELFRIQGLGSADGRAGTEILRSLLDEHVASTGAAAGGIFVIDEGGTNLELMVSARYPEPLADRFRLIPLSANVPLVDTVKTTSPSFVESLADYATRYPDFARAHPEIAKNAFASLPLVLDGRCVGGIALGFGAPRRFTAEQRQSLAASAVRFAAELEALRRAEVARAARRVAELATHRLERIDSFTRALAQAITPAQVVDVVIDIGLTTTTASASGLWLLPADGASLHLSRQAGSGVPGSEDGLPCPPILDAVRDGVPVWIESRAQLEERYPDVLGRPAGAATSFACLPLLALGRRVGVLTFGFEAPHRFLEDERAFLQVISWYAAQALERANIYAAEKGAKERAENDQRRSQLIADEARDADRAKDEFLAMLSHELRNPLAPIVTALDIMDHTGSQNFAEERAMIARNVRHLVRLLDDLLDVARVARGKVQLVTQRCELAAIVAAALEISRPLVEERAHRLAVSLPEHGLAVIADHVRLAQAIANLVTNAAKYTAPGGAISVSATADGGGVVIRVRDSGAGISPELLPRVFDLFVQSDGGLARSTGGLGIGLTVAKRLVDLHGGSLSAHSAGIGQGSEFVVRLPLAAAPAGAGDGAAEPAGARTPVTYRSRVLVVDDNHDAAEALGNVLRMLGCPVHVVHDGATAAAAAAAFDPQLVLLDIGLPDIDGYEVARRLRAAPRDRPLKIIALTGYGQPSDLLRSRDAGFDDHVVKPVAIEVIKRILDESVVP
jgi:signal transduction histidine kinase